MCREEITAGYNVTGVGLSDSEDSSQEVEISSGSNTDCDCPELDILPKSPTDTSQIAILCNQLPSAQRVSFSSIDFGSSSASRFESADVAWSLVSGGQISPATSSTNLLASSLQAPQASDSMHIHKHSILEGKIPRHSQAIESSEMLRNDRDAPTREAQDFMENPLMIALADRCIKKNSILAISTDVLVSGINSTDLAWLAFHVCQQWHGKHESEEPKKALFIAPTVPQVRQQHEVALKFFGRMKPHLIIGTAEVDNWLKADWQKVLSQYDTILTTPQLLLDALDAKYVSLSFFSRDRKSVV
jgi:hypothetical protein